MRDKFNNIVLIDTYNSLGSGVILPCRYDKKDTKDDKDFNYYIILTNYHVMHSREDITEPMKKLEGTDIHLTIFDRNNEVIPDEDYQIVIPEAVFPAFEEEDIAVLLVKIRKSFEISVYCQAGRQEELDEGDRIYTKGFPGILQEEADAMAVRFAGTLQMNRYKKGKMGTYRMEENFHYYADYSDETVFSGLSGGPVFVEKEEGIQLIGINQGVFADNYGDSPYQLVRFISLSHVLEYLRQNGYILYSLLYGKISIIWIKEKMEEIDKQDCGKQKEALCVLGGSGAGKSSFVESLTQHAGILETVGDGQTTRTDIYYYLSLYTDKPTVNVIFLDDKEFVEKMYHAVFPDLLAVIFTYKFGFRKIDIRVEPYTFLRDNLEYIKIVIEKWEQKYGSSEGKRREKEKFQGKYDSIYSICVNTKENEDEEEIYQSYINFCNIVFCCMRELNISQQAMKRIFDIRTREKIIRSLISLNEQCQDSSSFQIEDINLEEFYRELVGCTVKTTELAKNIRMLPYELKKMYVDAVWETNSAGQKEKDEKENKEYVKELEQILKEQKGIFSYREVSYLFQNDSEECNANFEVSVNADNFLKNMEKIFINDNERENNEIESYYKKLYSKVMAKITSSKETFKNENSLLDLSSKDKEFLNLCARSRHTKSLSAFVKYIEVRDSYYHEYAIPVYESGRNEMLLVDTCGLDHIDKGKGNRFTLSERVRQIKRKLEEESKSSSKSKYELNNLIYVKKLDAGRPTEVSDIFAYIADMDIEGGLYCVFTGLDIYEKSNHSFFARNKNWHIDSSLEGYPKIVQYLTDGRNKEELLRMCNCVSYRKEDLYRVMSKNIITYCANRELNEKQGKYQENNVIGIRYLFESVFQKEIELLQMPVTTNAQGQGGGEFIPEKEREAVEGELKKLLTTMFDMASVIKWKNYYWQTLNANLERYKKGEKGFARSYDHTWMHLFMEGYRIAFEQEYAEDFYRLFGKNERRVYTCVRQMKAEFVRKIIDEEDFLCGMYEKCSSKGVDIINPYKTEEVKEACDKEILISPTVKCANVLKRITNFGLLIRKVPKENGIDKLAECFLDMLKFKYEDTEKPEKNFFQVRADVRNKADELIKIISSYGFKEEVIKALLCQRVTEKQKGEV